jgi:hypothetical protein
VHFQRRRKCSRRVTVTLGDDEFVGLLPDFNALFADFARQPDGFIGFQLGKRVCRGVNIVFVIYFRSF